MATWKDEFDRRCRRLLGVTDDSKPVLLSTPSFSAGCDTCGYGGESYVEMWCGTAERSFDDMGELIRLLDEVVP